ncbi:MAG TPA: hypothetical protein VFX51_20495 [Solirubrobacteraceae bacterium]|nr:hypothetical protein [Solirubrobacteraceae bacterium]
MATLIEFFEVPPDADEAFLAEWHDARAGATLYRALREDAAVRFVSIALDGGSYELVHEDGQVDEPGGVTLIEPFEGHEGFVAAWQRLRALLATQRGYLGSRLYSATAEDLPYVAVIRWSSPLMRHRALQRPDVQMAAEPLRSFPTLYERAVI